MLPATCATLTRVMTACASPRLHLPRAVRSQHCLTNPSLSPAASDTRAPLLIPLRSEQNEPFPHLTSCATFSQIGRNRRTSATNLAPDSIALVFWERPRALVHRKRQTTRFYPHLQVLVVPHLSALSWLAAKS